MTGTRLEAPIVFAGDDNETYIYMERFPLQAGELLYSPDGVQLYQLAVGGLSGTSEEHRLSFTDPHRDFTGTLELSEETITLNGKRFERRPDGEPVNLEMVIPLPNVRKVEYLTQSDDGLFVYVSASKYAYSYESFRLFVGDGTAMREVRVANVARYRDGGTTYIATDERTFFSPSPFSAQRDENARPMWGDTVLTRLDASDYEIVDTGSTVTITKK